MENLISDSNNLGCYENIDLLHQIHCVSHLFQTTESKLWTMLEHQKLSFSYLLIKHGRRNADYEWTIEHRGVITCECTRHLGWLLFPEINESVELPKMVIERSELLEQSFNHIIEAEAETLRAGLRLEFKNEEAIGVGVRREWFSLVRKALFDPQNEFFEACSNERIRFFPNSGRVIALALMHKVQIGIVLDRVLFLQMVEKNVSLEDIRDVDLTVITLEMNAEFVDDKDNLALTFEIDGKNGKTVELVAGGAQIAVNSRNRRRYVDLCIQHYYVKSLAAHVAHFKKGFNDIINCSRKRLLFFQLVELEDLDMMLRGSAKPISTEEWMIHTVYNGYINTDSEIHWMVVEMSEEQKKNLLFFLGLLPTLCKYRKVTSHGLPTSNTCFNQLSLSPCPTLEEMQDRLNIVTREDISRRFGFE